MQLRVDRLTETPGPLSHRVDAPWWTAWCHATDAEAEVREIFVGELVFDGTAWVKGSDLFFEGNFSAELDTECARCLKRYRQPLRESYRLRLEPLKDRKPTDPECEETLGRHGMWLSEDLEAGFYRGKEIDLALFYAEVVALAIPVQPVCKQDCDGLCPHCGIDRSQTRCECVDTKPDSPFAALSVLKGSQPGSS
jgi:uncharacterized protein